MANRTSNRAIRRTLVEAAPHGGVVRISNRKRIQILHLGSNWRFVNVWAYTHNPSASQNRKASRDLAQMVEWERGL